MSQEREGTASSGWPRLWLNLGLLLGGIVLAVISFSTADRSRGADTRGFLIAQGILSLLTSAGGLVCLFGHFTLKPNEARVLILFGSYRGTIRQSGFYWANPFYSRGPLLQIQGQAGAAGKPSMRVSLRARSLNGDRLKVNDKQGNPIEIAAVVVWRVKDTAQALFDVDDYESYVRMQSETALRHLASNYAYDHGEDPSEPTLRGSQEEIAGALQRELQERLAKAGVAVDEARLSHLAYAPEIAQAMLRRQQAEAVIAARQKIVHGAVSMVEMALKELADKRVLQLDEERKAAMVSNLLVVLCGESEAQPVLNTGTLYS